MNTLYYPRIKTLFQIKLEREERWQRLRGRMGKWLFIIGLLSSLLVCSCTEERTIANSASMDGTTLILGMTRASQPVINHTQVYLFEGEGENAGQFNSKVPDVNQEDNRLTMSVGAGRWNLALISADVDIRGKLISPVRGHALNTLKMWETGSDGGELPSMPELRTAYIKGQQVVAGQNNIVPDALLSRNVALVKVVIADAGGLDIHGEHKFELTGVPTTLDWNGGLYPDKNNPVVSSDPMKGTFTVNNSPALTGHQVSDTLCFVIPAHKGVDYLSSYPADTTTHNLTFTLDLACDDGSRFTKANVAIPRVPRTNGILLVRLMVGGKLNVSAEILDWQDREVNVDLSQTQLYTDKASIGLSYKDTLHVNTNAESYTLGKAPDATWITSVKKLDGNAVEITADVETYVDNHPRTSYITLTANNVTKKIPVTQRPDKGTIEVDKHELIFCPVSHTKRSLQVTSIGGDWMFLGNSTKATPNIQGGTKGKTSVDFTRTSTVRPDDFETYYGDGKIVVKNKLTLDTDTISLINCYIHMDENLINAIAPTGLAQTAITNSQDITVFGGNRNILFDSSSSWIHDFSWNPQTQILTMTTDRDPADEARDGTLTFHHAVCPDYQVTAKVHQDIIVTIPAFDFFVVKFTWNGNDVDIAAEFSGNHVDGGNKVTYDKHPVGWSLGQSVTYNGKELLKWGGDATQGQGETAFFNTPVLEGDINSPRKIKLDIYATWYTSGRAPDTMTFTMYAYKGGTMVQSGTNFNNQGGETLYQKGHTVMITTTRGVSAYANGGYTRVATVTYDRIKHSATINLWASSANNIRSRRSDVTPLRPQEKPYWMPTIVNTYSNDYKGERK